MFGKTRQAHYKRKWTDDKLALKHAIVIKTVEEIRSSMPRVGTRKIKYLLDNHLGKHGIQISRDKLFDLLSDYGLLVRRRRRKRVVATTDSSHPFKKYPNLIKDLEVLYPDQLWVSDITYIALTNGFCYLSLITDAYSRKIVGYCVHPTLQKEGPLNALQMALSQSERHPGKPLIHHSDRGLQYCCKDYIEMLLSDQVSISMTEKGDPYENALAERVNGILKTEFLLNKTFKNYEEADLATRTAIGTYNEQRPHGSCDYLTPLEAYGKQGALRKRWHPGSIAGRKGFLRHKAECV